MPRLDIRVVGARGLPDVQTFGQIDPFCTVELEHKRFQTSTAENTQNPQWNEVFKFNVADSDSSQLMFSVWNDNAMSDDFLGCYPMSISGLNRGEVEEKTVLLQQCKSNAELTVRILAVDFGDVEEPESAYAPPRPKPHAGLPPQFQQQYQQQAQQQQQYFQQAPPQQYQAPPPPPPRPVYRPQPSAPCPPGFNGQEYLSLHGDLQQACAQSGQEPNAWAINHWNQYGHNEGRAYSRTIPPYDFNPEEYINKHPDLVQAAQGQYDRRRWATEHWLNFGVGENRRYRGAFTPGAGATPPGFHAEEYISLHPDLVNAAASQPDRDAWGKNHYLDFGHKEGRAYSRVILPFDFDAETYINKHPDLQNAAASQPDRRSWGANHWLEFGVNEGRRYR